MKNKYKVSILVSTFNRLDYLKRCLSHIYAQDYSDYEIIIVDDASTDGTAEYLKSLVADNLKIILHETNMGLARSRNDAWRTASGQYVAFLDDDDFWIDPQKLTKQVEILDASPRMTGICCTDATTSLDSSEDSPSAAFPDHIEKHILVRNGVIHTSSVMAKRSLINEVGGFDEKLTRGIDSDLYRTALTKHGYQVVFIQEKMVYYETKSFGRITDRRGKKEAIDITKQYLYIVWKFRGQFAKNPDAFINRAILTGKSCLRFLLNNK